MLGVAVVDGDHREFERAVVRHCPQANHARRRLFRPADDAVEQLAAALVDRADEVSAVVHRHLWLMIERRLDVVVVGVVVFALDGVNGDFVVRHQRRRYVILRRQRVGGAQDDVRAAHLQRVHQIRRLGGDVQARRDAHALQRFLFGEALADRPQDRHFMFRPLDPVTTPGRLVEVFDIVFDSHRFS